MKGKDTLIDIAQKKNNHTAAATVPGRKQQHKAAILQTSFKAMTHKMMFVIQLLHFQDFGATFATKAMLSNCNAGGDWHEPLPKQNSSFVKK